MDRALKCFFNCLGNQIVYAGNQSKKLFGVRQIGFNEVVNLGKRGEGRNRLLVLKYDENNEKKVDFM